MSEYSSIIERETILADRLVRARSVTEYRSALDALESFRSIAQLETLMNQYHAQSVWTLSSFSEET
jgi:hypothetical protein